MNIDMQARKTQALENSELLQAYKMANPEALESYKKDPDAISFLQFERDVIPAITQSVQMSDDPDGFVSKMNLRGIITSYGYDKETADSLIEAGIGSNFSGVDLEHKSYGEAFLGTMKNALYEELKGTATSIYFFTGDPQLLEFAHGYQRKLEANPILQDYGEIGDLVIGSVQPAMSSLKFVANTALLSWLPGAIGAKTGIKAFQTAAKAGGLLATGLNFTSAGMSQAGSVMYDLYNTTDANGNTLPMDSMAAKLLFPVLVFGMGAVELASLSQLPGYKHISRHFTQKELTKALVGGFFEGVKRWGWDSLKSTVSEAVEEGVQYLLGLGFETVLKHVANKGGAEFEFQTMKETFAETTKQIYEAGKSMILTSMLSGGLAQGFYSYQMKSMSKQNFAQTKTSQPMDAFFVNTPKAPVQEEAKVTPKGDTTLDKGTTGETDKETTGEDVVDEKLEPIKVVRVGERLVPINAVEAEKARTANQRKAKVVEIEVSQDYAFDTDSQTKMAHQAAIATEGKIVDGTTIAYETESDLQYGTFMLAPNIEAVEKTEKGSRVTLRNEDGSLSKLDLVIADDTMETSEPDLAFVENPEAPYALSHMKEDRAYQWHERQIVKDAIGDVIQHTGGRISSAGLEASVDAIILTAEALNKPTDELVSKNVVFELVTDLSNEKGDPANAKIEYQKDNQGNKIYKITLNDSANVGSLTHEVGHLLRGLATKEQLQSFVDHYGKGNTAIWLDDITETAGGKFELAGKEYNTFAEAAKQVNKYEEKFASDFVTYLRTGKAPTTALQNIFSRMKAVLKSLVGAYGYELDPAVKRAFDQLFAESEVGVSQETQSEVGNEVGNLDEKSVIEGSDLFEMSQEQYDKVLSDYKGTDKWLLSPNGSPTNLTEKQWVQVRTPAFLSWFGDWLNDPGSIHPDALDLNGEPEIFYHGSSSNTIEEFELQPSLGYYNENNRGGFSFTNDKRAAEAYAQPEAVRVRSIQKYLTEVEEALNDAGIVDVMSLEEGEKLDATSQKFYDLLKEDDDVGYFGEEQTLPDFHYVYWDNEDNPFSKGRDEWSKIIPRLIQKDFPVLAKRLRSANKDVKLKGVTTPKVYEVFLNIPKGTRTQDLTRSTLYKIGDYFDVRQEDTKAFVARLGNNEKVVYIADSSMIKSATDNRGSFSASPNILYEEALTIDWDMLPFDADIKTLETKEQIAAHNTVVEIANLLIEDDRLTYDMLSDLSKLEKLLIDGDENSLLDKMEDRFNAVNSDIYLMDLYEEHLEYDEGQINEVWGVIDVFELAVQERGLTDDIYEAGYILPDGRLLDFSEKRDGGPAGTRSADHRSLALAVNEDLSGTDLMVAFQKMGAIRIDANSGLIDLETSPTYAQNSVIKDLIIMNEEAYVDLQDGVRRASFQSGGDPDRAISLIARFYNGQDINQGTVLFEMAPPVDSEEFMAKFGNTKVADSYGNPILVSHGSPYQFDDFKKTQVSDAGYLGAGYYFSGLRGVAEQYATKSENGFIYKAYLNMEHPFLWQEEWNKQWNVVTSSIEQEHPTVHRGSDEFGRLITSKLKEMGYDGVLDMKNGIVNEAVVFDNNQVGIVTVEGFNISDMSKLYQPNFGSDGVLYEAVENKKPLEDRVFGDKLDEIYEAMEDIRDVGGYVDEYGYITVYHRTSRVAADEIARTGIMVAKEDGLFFSTERDGQAVGYGDSIVKLEIPLEQLEMDDMFNNEIHFRLPLKRILRKNVSPFNPTVLFEQAAPVESEAFKAWFGDSKMVDDNGNPLVMYHGTGAAFSEFSESDQVSGKLGKGIYLTPNKNAANLFAKIRGKNGTPLVMELYANIEHPYTINGDGNVPYNTIDKEVLQGKGYDGIILTNNGIITEVVAFSPTQVKSVNNQGTWDNTNPNILFEKAAPLGSKAFKAWFGDSKVVDDNGNPLVMSHGTDIENLRVFDTSDKTLDFTIPHGRGDNIGAFFTAVENDAKDFGENVVKVYLKLENPMIFNTQDDFRVFMREHSGQTPDIRDSEGYIVKEGVFENLMREEIESQGYDGVIIKDPSYSRETGIWAVAFYPTQVKSVFNSGAWDIGNPNVLYEKLPKLSAGDLDALGIDKFALLLADRTAAGYDFTGMDGATVTPYFLQGGPGYATLDENLAHDIVWAVQGKGKTTVLKNRAAETDGYVLVLMMAPYAHRSNITVVDNYIKIFEKYVEEGDRIKPKDLKKIYNIVKKAEVLKDMPYFGDVEAFYDWFYNKSTFDVRAELMNRFGLESVQKLGMPPLEKYLKLLEEKNYNIPSMNLGDGLLLLKIDTSENFLVELGTEGTPIHPSYKYGIKGKPVGILAKPLGRQLILEEYSKQRREGSDGTVTAQDWRATEWASPVVQITDRIREVLQGEGYQYIKGGRHANIIVDFLADNWITSDQATGEGGISNASFIKALKNNRGSESLTIPTEKVLNQRTKAGLERIYKLSEWVKDDTGKNVEIYFSLKFDKPWYSEQAGLGENEVVLQSVMTNELGMGQILPMIMAKAISEGATVLDAFALKTDDYPKGMLPTVYGRYGFETVFTMPWDQGEYDKTHTASQFRDLIAYWETLGWSEERHGMPDLVVMKINEETIGGREGYLQRFISQDGEGFWHGDVERGIDESVRNHNDGRGTGEVSRAGERDGATLGRDQGYNGWDSGRKALANQSLEVLSLEKIDRENLGIDEQAYNKAIERHGYRTMPEESSATTLYELSDEAKQHVLESRKKDVQTAIEQFYWISDEILKEYIGEEWADNELRFREHLKEFPWALEEARKFADTEEFLEHLKTSTEVADYQWALEDEQWFKRIHAYSRIMSPEQRDAQFIRLHTASHDKLLALGNRLKGYEDVASVPRAKSRKGPRKFVTYKWGAFKGVSTHVKRLTKNSTDVEFERAAELIQKNPRPYRQAIQVIEQAEARVLEMKGLSHRTDASREAYYDSLGEDMQEMLKEPLALNEMTNREAAEYLRSSDDSKERYDARDRLATHEGVLALEQQADRELKELGAAKDIDIKKATKQLSKALDQVETINEDFKQAKNELRKTLTSLKNERKRVAEISGKLKEKTAQASQVNQLTKDLADRRARVKELRSLLTEQNENVRKLTKTKESLQRRLEAKRTRQTLEKLHGRILKTLNYNSDSIDASFESVFNAIKNIFDQKQKSDGTVIQLPKEMSQYLSQNHLEWILKGKKIGQWSVESLEVLLEAAKLMRMDARAMLDQKKLKRTTELQNLALEMYRQTYGQTPEISPGYGSIMNDIISDLMTKQHQYEENVFNAMLDTVKASIGKVQRIARVLDGHKEGVMYDLLVRRAYSHMTEEIRETYRRLEEADAKMKELGINDEHLLKHTFKFTPKSGQERTLTKGEVIGIYVYSQNPLGKNKLVHDRGNQLSPMDIARAIGSLTENEKAWGDYMIDSLGGDEVWERQRDVFYEVYNQNLGRRDRYFTFVSEGKVLDEGKTDILAGPKGQKLRYTDKDFTKVVNPNAVYPLRLDVTGTFGSQVKKQEHFIQWAAWTRDMNYLLSKGAIGKIIEMQNGPKYLAAVESYVREVGSPQTLMDDIERLGSKLVSNAAVAALSLNYLTMLKQLPSFTAALRGDVGALELLQVSMRLTNPQTHAEAIAFIHEMSPYMMKRAISVEIERYNATDFNTYAGRKIGEFNEKIGMKGIYFMDQAAVNTLWLAAYDTYLRRNPMGLEGDALKQEAAFRATQLISETQPTSIITDLSSIQTKKSPWVRSALLFTNQMFQYVNMVWYDLPTSVKAFKATKDPAHIRKIFGIVTNMAMSGALIMLISGVAFRKDDEDDKAYWKRIGKEVAQTVANYSIPIVGNMVSQGASGYSSGSIVDLPSAFGRLLGTDWTDAEKVSNRIWDLLDAGASVTALPTAFINRLIKSIDRKNPLEMFGAHYGELWESR